MIDTLLGSQQLQFVLLRMALIIVLTLLAAKLIIVIARKRKEPKLHQKFIHSIVLVLLYCYGFILVLTQIPRFNNTLGAFLAGSGVIALSLSLAAQESLGNVINGLVLSVSKPFEVGDRIHLVNADITGYVEDISMRHTVIRTFLNSRIIIPNSVINKDMVENFDFLEETAAGFLDVVIKYESDVDRAITIMADVVGGHPDFFDRRKDPSTPKVAVFLRDLTLQGVALRAIVTTHSIERNFSTCSEVRHNIKLAFDQAGIQFAVTSRP